MPRLASWFIRAALLNLLLGAAIGAALLWDVGLPFAAWPWRLLVLHGDALIFGWLVQVTMGVASWIFPRPELQHGPEGIAKRVEARVVWGWGAFVLLNLGVAIAACGGGLDLRAIVMEGKTLEASSAATFAFYLWPRIRGLSVPLLQRRP